MEEKGVSQLISVDFRKKVGGTEREKTSHKVTIQGPFAPQPAPEPGTPDAV
jgi:hypothetical protein